MILDAAGGLGRSRRTRKEVNYSDNTTNTDGRDGSADGAPDAVVPERGGRRGSASQSLLHFKDPTENRY